MGRSIPDQRPDTPKLEHLGSLPPSTLGLQETSTSTQIQVRKLLVQNSAFFGGGSRGLGGDSQQLEPDEDFCNQIAVHSKSPKELGAEKSEFF